MADLRTRRRILPFQGQGRVRYGAGGRFREASFRNGVDCSNSTFGNSAPGIPKFCQVRD